MKRKICIISAVIVCAIAMTMQCHSVEQGYEEPRCLLQVAWTESGCTIQDSHEDSRRHGDMLIREDDGDCRYTDLNSAFISGGTSSISSARTQTGSGIARHSSSAKRLVSSRETLAARAGKSLTINSVDNFHSLMGLFPSGLGSRSHSFIRMCRLTI